MQLGSFVKLAGPGVIRQLKALKDVACLLLLESPPFRYSCGFLSFTFLHVVCVSGAVGQETLLDAAVLTSKPSFSLFRSPCVDFIEWEGQYFSLTFHYIVISS